MLQLFSSFMVCNDSHSSFKSFIMCSMSTSLCFVSSAVDAGFCTTPERQREGWLGLSGFDSSDVIFLPALIFNRLCELANEMNGAGDFSSVVTFSLTLQTPPVCHWQQHRSRYHHHWIHRRRLWKAFWRMRRGEGVRFVRWVMAFMVASTNTTLHL